MFARIEDLAQFENAISGPGRQTIVRAVRGPLVIFDYAVADKSTFTSRERRECRGITFDARDGRLVSRPYDKFFNLDEHPETQRDAIAFDRPHHVLEKLDGSMMHGLVHEDEVRLFTRLGPSEQARTAETFAREHVQGALHLVRALDEEGATGMFEYCAPDNVVVVGYERPRLVLTGVRDRKTGVYRSHADLVDLARRFSVEVVEAHPGVTDLAGFVEGVFSLTGREGVVVRFEDGFQFKLKSAWYVGIHKIRYQVAAHEPTLLSLVLDGRLDDVLPHLAGTPDFERVRTLAARFEEAITLKIAEVEARERALLEPVGHDRARFAKEVLPTLSLAEKKHLAPLLFEIAKGRRADDVVRAFVRRAVVTDEARGSIVGAETWETFKAEFFGLSW